MKILIATSRFKDLAGSEITVFEYAEEFTRHGYNVSIASFEKTALLLPECNAAGITVSTFDDEVLIETEWDLIWVLHPPAYYALFTHFDYQTKKTIFSSLSHFEPLESPPIEVRQISLFTTNSCENKRFFCEQFPDYSPRVVVLPNSIPENFWTIEPVEMKEKKLIIVSNHLPDEVLELAERLRISNWQVDIFGVGHLHKKVSAEDMVNYRACISIGKTVQYSLGLKIPIFCYDRFGGPGWITPENVERAAEFNFSGRCTNSKLNAEILERYFVDNVIPDSSVLEQLYEYARNTFSLTNNINNILTLLNSTNDSVNLKNTTLKNILARHLDIFLRDQKLQSDFQLAWNTESQRRFRTEEKLLEVHKAWQLEINRSHDDRELIYLKAENDSLKEQLVQQDEVIKGYASKIERYIKFIQFAKKTRSGKKAYRTLKILKRFKALIHKVKK